MKTRNIFSNQLFCAGLLIVLFAILVPSNSTNAQTSWLIDKNETSISVEFVKATFPNAESDERGLKDFGFLSSTIFLSGRYKVNPGLMLVAELPISTHSATYQYRDYGQPLSSGFQESDVSGTAFGNLYLGVEAGTDDRQFYADAGIRVPVIDYRALPYSVYNEPLADENYTEFTAEMSMNANSELFGAFLDEFITLTGAANWQLQFLPPKLNVRVRFGFTNFYKHVEGHDGAYSFLNGGIFTNYNFDKVKVLLVWQGIYNPLDTRPLRLALRDYAGLGVLFPAGQFDLGLMYRAPLREDMYDDVSGIFHLLVTYNIGMQ